MSEAIVKIITDAGDNFDMGFIKQVLNDRQCDLICDQELILFENFWNNLTLDEQKDIETQLKINFPIKSDNNNDNDNNNNDDDDDNDDDDNDDNDGDANKDA